MMRKSIVKAFDPLYESPLKSSLSAVRLETIPDIAFANETLFFDTSDSITSLNDSIEKVENFIENIITEAVNKIIPSDSTDHNITNLINIDDHNPKQDSLIQVEQEIFYDSIPDEKSDLEKQVTEADCINTKKLEIGYVGESELLQLINDTNSDFVNSNLTKQFSEINITEQEVEISGLNVESDFGDIIIKSPLNICKEKIDNLEKGDSNKIQELNENIINKDQELFLIKEELLRKTREYEALEINFKQKDQEMIDIKSKYEEYKIVKENYHKQYAEISELKLKYTDYDRIKEDNENKKKEIAELKEKCEQAISSSKEKADCDENEEYIQLLKCEYAIKEKQFEDIMNGYTQLFNTQLAKCQTLIEESSLLKTHLATLEVAFADVHQKYERSKTIIDGYKSNEEQLRSTLQMYESAMKKYEVELETLQQKSQNENQNLRRELAMIKEENAAKLNKHLSKIRHLEIKTTSLTNALEQKIKECEDLTKLCEEVTDRFQD